MTKMERESQNTDLKKSEGTRPKHTNLLSRRALWSRLGSGIEARARFVESNLSKNLAFQIRALRDRREWSQGELGERVEMNQNAISRLENPFYGKATLSTLKRIASAFDVALVVRFVPFGQLVDWVSGTPFSDLGMSPVSLCPASFALECQISQLGSASVGTGIANTMEPKNRPKDSAISELLAKGQAA